MPQQSQHQAHYIKDNLGPRAMLRDLTKVAMVLSRFGPRLPEIIEGILTRSTEEQDQKTALTRIRVLKILPLAIIFTAIGFALAQIL